MAQITHFGSHSPKVAQNNLSGSASLRMDELVQMLQNGPDCPEWPERVIQTYLLENSERKFLGETQCAQ